MKKLTKTLSLVLVIAMIVSLCVVGVSAKTFSKDGDKINDAYKEAVDVMSGIGIISGTDAAGTTFNPTGNFTRAAAAKIIAYMQLGVSAAEALKGTSNTFKDVPATYWAAPYIAYCAQQKIIAGYGNGNFGPDDALTGYAWAKMLLCAVGYGVKGEYSGASWSINVAKDALTKGVFTDVLSASTNEVITREQATQMAFNTLTNVSKVTYSTLLGDYIDSTGTVAGSGISGVNTKGTLGKTIYSLDVAHNQNNGYGVMGRIWYTGTSLKADKSNAVSGWYQDDATVETLTGPVTKAAFVAKYTADSFDESTAIAYWYNGAKLANVSYASLAAAASTDVIIPAGSTVTLLDTNDNNTIDKIVVVEQYAGVVTTANATAGTCTVVGNFGTVTVKNSNSYVKGDVLMTTPLYTNPGFSTVKFIAAAKVAKDFTGKVTAYGAGYIKVDGTAYNLSANVRVEGGTAVADMLGKTYDFYKDSTGAIAYIANQTDTAAALTYCYVTKSASAQASLASPTAYARASVVTTDGKTAVVNVYTYTKNNQLYYVNAAGAETLVPDSTSNGIVAPGYYSYTVMSDGSYQFTALNAKKAVGLNDAQILHVENKSSTVTAASSTLLATSATTLNVSNNGSTTTTTGYTAWATKDYTCDSNGTAPETYVLYTKGSAASVVTGIYVFSPAAATTTTYAYYYGATGETSAAGVSYKFYVNGEVKDYVVTNAVTPVKGTIYGITVASDGTSATLASVSNYTALVSAVDTGYFTTEAASTTAIPFATTCKTYDATTAGSVAETTLTGETTTTHGCAVTYVLDSGNAAVIFVTAAPTTK